MKLRALHIGAEAGQVGGIKEQAARPGIPGGGRERLGGAAGATQGQQGAETKAGAEKLATGNGTWACFYRRKWRERRKNSGNFDHA